MKKHYIRIAHYGLMLILAMLLMFVMSSGAEATDQQSRALPGVLMLLLDDEQKKSELQILDIDVSPAKPEVNQEFTIDVTIGEQAGIETNNLAVNLTIAGTGIDQTISVAPIQGGQDTISFGDLNIGSAGEYTVEVTGDADNAEFVKASEVFEVEGPDYIVTTYQEFQDALQVPGGGIDGQFVVEVAGDIILPASPLTYGGKVDLLLRGQDGENFTLDARGFSRILKIEPPGGSEVSVKIENLDFVGGKDVVGNAGGAIYASGSFHSLEIYNSNFLNNSAEYGGAIYASGSFHSLEIYNSNFLNNSAEYGGAIWTDSKELYINNSLFEKNAASKYGGAFRYRANDGKVFVDNSEFIKNSAYYGAALALRSTDSNVLITNSEIARNEGYRSILCFYHWRNYNHLALSEVDFINNSISGSGGSLIQYSYGNYNVGGNRFLEGDNEPNWANISLVDLGGSPGAPAMLNARDDFLLDSLDYETNTHISNYDHSNELYLMGDVHHDDIIMQDSPNGEDLQISVEKEGVSTEITLVGLGGMGFSSVSEFNNSNLGDISYGCFFDWAY